MPPGAAPAAPTRLRVGHLAAISDSSRATVSGNGSPAVCRTPGTPTPFARSSGVRPFASFACTSAPLSARNFTKGVKPSLPRHAMRLVRHRRRGRHPARSAQTADPLVTGKVFAGLGVARGCEGISSRHGQGTRHELPAKVCEPPASTARISGYESKVACWCHLKPEFLQREMSNEFATH